MNKGHANPHAGRVFETPALDDVKIRALPHHLVT